jgi:hypothetical protein
VARLASLRHPALAPVEVLRHAPGELILATPAGRSLHDVAAEQRAQGLEGIRGRRLLGWLRTAAEALHELAEKEGLFHLALQPRSLLLDEERLWLTDFALAQLLWRPCGRSPGSLAPRYAAPELSEGALGTACDQYSLALIYHELLTGALPEPLPGRRNERGVERLPQAERDAVARALHPDPAKRWPSVTELIAALEQACGAERSAPTAPPVRRADPEPVATTPSGYGLQARLGTDLTAEDIRQRLDGFRQQWNARVLSEQGPSFLYQVQAPAGLWQRLMGRQPVLEVAVEVGEPEMTAPAGVKVRTEVALTVRARDCSAEKAAGLLEGVGSMLVESVRRHLRAGSRGRQQERVPWPYPLQMRSILPGGFGPPIECHGKDLSLSGIGFYVPGQLPSTRLLLRLPKTAQTPQMVVPARVVRVQGCGDGWYEVGAVLAPDELPPGEADLEKELAAE